MQGAKTRAKKPIYFLALIPLGSCFQRASEEAIPSSAPVAWRRQCWEGWKRVNICADIWVLATREIYAYRYLVGGRFFFLTPRISSRVQYQYLSVVVVTALFVQHHNEDRVRKSFK